MQQRGEGNTSLSCRCVPTDCFLPVAPGAFDLALCVVGGGGGPIGSGELYMHVIAVSFHALCMPHLQHVEGSEARSYPGLEAHASLFGVQHPVPVDTRVSSHTIYILWVQQFSRSLLLFIYFNFYFKSLSSRLIHSVVKRHRLPTPHFSG